MGIISQLSIFVQHPLDKRSRYRALRKGQCTPASRRPNYRQKNGQPKLPEIALRALQLEGSVALSGSRRLDLVRILPDEITEASKEGDHQPDGADTGDYHYVHKHGYVLSSCTECDGFKVARERQGKIDPDQ